MMSSNNHRIERPFQGVPGRWSSLLHGSTLLKLCRVANETEDSIVPVEHTSTWRVASAKRNEIAELTKGLHLFAEQQQLEERG